MSSVLMLKCFATSPLIEISRNSLLPIIVSRVLRGPRRRIYIFKFLISIFNRSPSPIFIDSKSLIEILN
ncbi:MAG: hypothetical protein QXQ32_06945 [Candidatus Methanomethylicia archaeon]